MMAYSDWEEMRMSVSDILLDYDNPRVFIEEPTQENLLRFLINEDQSIELANQIVLNRGLPLAEKPVVTMEGDKYIVLEGNRRISACKLLLDPSVLTNKEAKRIPQIDTELEDYLNNFPVVLAPNRDSAEAFITLRHSGDKSVKKWSTIASTKRFVNRFNKGESINHISRVLNEKNADVRKGIRFFFFLEFIKNEIEWKEEEKIKLEIYKMETTKLDRFLPFSKKAKEILKIDFNADQTIKSSLPEELFKLALKNIITRIYITNEIDTRTPLKDVFNAEIMEICKIHLDTNKEIEITDSNENDESVIDKINSDSSNKIFKNEINQETSINEVNQEKFVDTIKEKETKSTNITEKDTNEINQHSPSKKLTKLNNDAETYMYLTGAYPFKNFYKENNRINELLKEITRNKYKETRMSSMYLIRSLLETYTHEYIDHFLKEDKRENKIKGVAKERTKRNQKLRELMYNNIKEHLSKCYPQYEEVIELIEITFTKNNNAAATRIINFYIHSQTQVPDYHELLDAWRKVSTILKCLDEIMSEDKLSSK